MNFLTHIHLAAQIYKRLGTHARLERLAFIYGSIKPDLEPRASRKPHTAENYLAHIGSLAENLISSPPSPRSQSLILGEICHYLCDFFCYYHTSDMIDKSMVLHYIYEMMLHFRSMHTKIPESTASAPFMTIPARNIQPLVAIILEEYLSGPASLQRDLDYAFTASMLTIRTIIHSAAVYSEIEPYDDFVLDYIQGSLRKRSALSIQ